MAIMPIKIRTPNIYLAIFAEDPESFPFPAPKEITK